MVGEVLAHPLSLARDDGSVGLGAALREYFRQVSEASDARTMARSEARQGEEMRYLLLIMLLAACGYGEELRGCYIACTNGVDLIHIDKGVTGDTRALALQHEDCHITLEHKWPATLAMEMEADECAEERTLELGISPCPAARILRESGQLTRAFALGERNSCAGFWIR